MQGDVDEACGSDLEKVFQQYGLLRTDARSKAQVPVYCIGLVVATQLLATSCKSTIDLHVLAQALQE